MECLRIVTELDGTRRSIFCQAGISPDVAASYSSSCGAGEVLMALWSHYYMDGASSLTGSAQFQVPQ